MKHLRVLLAALVAVGGLAACGSKSDTGTASGSTTTAAAAPSPTLADPKTALLASVTTFTSSSFAFHVKQAQNTAEGTVDPTKKSALISVNTQASGQPVALGYTMIGQDLWMKIDLGQAGNSHFGIDKTKWMHIDKTKVKDKTVLLPQNPDGSFDVGTSTLLAGLADLKAVDATHITGTLDDTNPNSMLSPDKDIITKIGDKGKAVPFTATVDDKGRLTVLKIDGTAIDPALAAEATFDTFGSVPPITKPAGAINAPAALYTSLFAG